MPKSLTLQLLVPFLAAIACWGAVAGVEHLNRQALRQQFLQVIKQRDVLDRNLLELEERHGRAMRRAREAMLDGRNTQALLRYTSARYLVDMERGFRDTLRALDMAAARSGDPQGDGDVDRMRKQLARIMEEAIQTGRTLEILTQVRATGDALAIGLATRELERHDRGMATLFLVAEGMARGVFATAARRASAQPWPDMSPVLPIAAAVTVAALWLCAMPAQRLRQLLARGDADAAAPPPTQKAALFASREERDFIGYMNALRGHHDELRRRLGAARVDVERAALTGRRTEHELALLRCYNDNLVNSLRSAIVVTDLKGTITAINRTGRAILNLDEEAIGAPMTVSSAYEALLAQNARLAQDIQEAMTQRRALRYEAVPYMRGDEKLLLDLTLSPYQDESGAARGLLWVADDVTDAVHTKHQLLGAERLAAVGRLSAQVAHEIRNPLSAIGLNAELLEEEFLGCLPTGQSKEARTLLRSIGQEIERLTEVTETYLHLARLPRPNVRPVDINQIIRDVFVMQGEELRAHNIQWNLTLTENPRQSPIDPGQIRQALLNIIRNSREAMEAGGVLSVETRATDDGTSIIIADTGHGIPADVLPRVFEPFYSTKTHGTGLGLSLTHQIVTEHGGSVQAETCAPKGAKVRIFLPEPMSNEAVIS